MNKVKSNSELQNTTEYENFFTMNDFIIAGNRCDVAVEFISDSKLGSYFVVCPDQDTLKEYLDNPEKINKDMRLYSPNSDTLNMRGTLYKICDNEKIVTPSLSDAFCLYSKGMDIIQAMSIASHAYKACHCDNPMPPYCWISATKKMTDLKLKMNNKNIEYITRKDYEKIFCNYVQKVADAAFEIRNEKMISMMHISPDRYHDPIREWKNHQVKKLDYFAYHNMVTITSKFPEPVWNFIKKQMKGTDFVFFHHTDMDYTLKDLSTVHKSMGIANPWKHDTECNYYVITYPQAQESMLTSWILEKQFTDYSVQFTERTYHPQYVPFEELSKQGNLVKITINSEDWPNIVSMTDTYNIKVTCDFTGEYTHESRSMDNLKNIPMYIKADDYKNVFIPYIQNKLMDDRRTYIPYNCGIDSEKPTYRSGTLSLN